MKSLALITLPLLLISVSACKPGKDETKPAATNATPAASSSSSGNPLTAPVDYLGAVAKAKQSATRSLDVTGINSALNTFYVQEDRYPKDLNELVTKKYISSLPVAPPGKKFSYNSQTGDLKLVPQ